jgi:hypothetical protein
MEGRDEDAKVQFDKVRLLSFSSSVGGDMAGLIGFVVIVGV